MMKITSVQMKMTRMMNLSVTKMRTRTKMRMRMRLKYYKLFIFMECPVL